MKRIKVLKWEKISLVVPEKEDVEVWYKGINDIETQAFLNQFWNILHKETEEEYYESLRKDEKGKTFCIFVNKIEKVIWNVSLMNIDYFSRNAEIWIAIFDKKEQDKWYGTEALELILKYAFEILWLHKVFLRYLDFNKRAEKVYKKLWFREIWTKKEEKYIFWEYKDEILMEMMRSEYKK